MTSPAALAELALIGAAPAGAVAEPGEGEVLVVAIAPHKVGPPPNNGQPDRRVKYWPGQQYVTSREGAVWAQQRGIVHILSGAAFDWYGHPGRVPSPFGEGRAFATTPQPGSLRIAQGVGYDPGAAAYRFHAAINACSKHASGFAIFPAIDGQPANPHSRHFQLDAQREAALVRDMALTADVHHNHVGYYLTNNAGVGIRPDQLLVVHYHGSRPDYTAWPIRSGPALVGDRCPGAGGLSFLEWDATRGAKVVAARLALVREIEGVAAAKGVPVRPEWLPIPMDVDAYACLVSAPRWDGTGTFRIAHSPTNRRFKGSDVYDRVVARLRAKGLAIEPVTIMGLSHGDALRRKATCHATFDSFWLGMQGSGLEAGAMGLPVLAGDADAAEAHRAFCGMVPWTFTPDERALGEAIERLVTDVAFYEAEAARVRAFVASHHSYPAVARRYETLLAGWLGRDDVFTTRSSEVAGGGDPLQSAGPLPEVAGGNPAASPPRRRRRGRAA
jgi:hypothetical protein